MKQAGNTLIELLIATVIVGLVLTAVAMTMMYSIKREANNRYLEYATQLAVEASEELNLRRAILGWQNFRDTYTSVMGSTNWCFYYTGLDTDPQIEQAFCDDNPSQYYMDQFNIDFKTDMSIRRQDANEIVAEITVMVDPGNSDEYEYLIRQHYYEREY